MQSSVSWTLGTELENLTLSGTAAINATGNTLTNVLTGNAAAIPSTTTMPNVSAKLVTIRTLAFANSRRF